MTTGIFRRKPRMLTLVCLATCSLACLPAYATYIPLGDAGNYTVLYDGLGGNQLSLTNVTVNGNIGVGNNGTVAFSGPGKINGSLSFSAANTNQFSNTNGSNIGPSSVHYSVSQISSDLSSLTTLSSTLGGATGTAINLVNGNQTINESSGTLFSSGGVTYRVFTVGSVSDQAGQMLTINGDGSGDPVLFNFSSSANLQGDVTLTGGLSADGVLWDFKGGSNGTGGPTVSLNNNASSYSQFAWYGDILDPNGAISVTNANLVGRVFGGDDHNLQITSGSTITAPVHVPEPGTLALSLLALTILVRQHRSRPVRQA
jgi:hypothetical protein